MKIIEEDDTLRHLIVYEESGFPDEDEWTSGVDDLDLDGDGDD
jgi:hypothetical protein